MYRIAICDDDPLWIEQCRDYVRNVYKEEWQVTAYESTGDLLQDAADENRRPDVLLLDIDMPQCDGFETAEKLREMAEDMLIIFCSSHDQYVYDSLQYQPFRYIRKNRAEQELHYALEAAWQVVRNRAVHSVQFKNEQGEYCVVKNTEILYYETERRHCRVYLADGTVLNVRKTIRELMEAVGKEDYVQIHSGIVVNVRYIKRYSDANLILDNGIRLNISRGRAKDVRQAVTAYWRKHV